MEMQRMSVKEIINHILLLMPVFVLLFCIAKINIYKIYGFKSLQKIIGLNCKQDNFKIIMQYILFWSLILLMVMYLIALYKVFNTSWWLI